MLEHYYPEFRIGHLDWTETPQEANRSLLHRPPAWHRHVHVVVLKAACERKGVELRWEGHHLDRPKLKVPGMGVPCPDAHFVLDVPGAGAAHHFLEMDRGSVSLARMAERYQAYLAFWRAAEDSPVPHFRVITVTEDAGYVDSLRRVAAESCRSNWKPWKGLPFTSADAYSLQEPKRILGPVFRYSDNSAPVSLLAGAERSRAAITVTGPSVGRRAPRVQSINPWHPAEE
jgi:hypothetical protein